jgi:UDP-glucose 4-epimerase
MPKILVTGAGGYIGSIASYLFLQNNYEIVAVDNFMRGYQQPLEELQKMYGPEKIRFYAYDLKKDLSELFEKEKNIDLVVHYAALCNVEESMKDPGIYFANDTWGCSNLIETMTKYGVNKLVFSSTCAVYGQSQYVPLDEKHPYGPISPYGESKRMAEQVIEWYGKLKGLNYVMLRYFNICGASDDGLFGDSKHPSYHLMQNAVRGALGIEPFNLTCPEVDTPDKTPIRDYINVVDLSEAHLAAVKYLMDGGESNVFNLGTGTGNSVMEIVKKVEEITGVKIDIQKGTPRTGDPAKLIASIEKAQSILKWQPKRTIADSVNSLVTWYKKHPQGWV